MEKTKQLDKELNFLDEKMSNINLEMITLEKEKNKIEEEKAILTSDVKNLEEEKKNILLKSENHKGIIKYLYMIIQANSDLKTLKIIDAKLEENRKNLQKVEDKLDIKNQLIKDKMNEKADVWKKREKIYMGTYKEAETEKQTTTNENSKDLNSLINLYNLVNQVTFEDKKANAIKEKLIKNLNTNIEEYIKENNIQPPKNMKAKNTEKEEENEC